MKYKPMFYATLVIIALIAIIFIQHIGNKNLSEKLGTANNNLAAEQFKYKTDSTGWAVQNRAIEVETSDLRKVNKIADDLLNSYEKKLKKAYSVIKYQKKRIKDVESVNSIIIETTGGDSIPYEVVKIDTVFVVNITDFDDGYLKAVFKPINSTLLQVDYVYNDNIDITTTRERDAKDKRFFLWRVLRPKYVHYSTITTGNDKSDIKVNDFIYLEK